MGATDGSGESRSTRRVVAAGLAIAGAALAALALAAGADAATVGLNTDPGVSGCPVGVQCPQQVIPIVYVAAAGEANDLTVSRNGLTNRITFTELGGVTVHGYTLGNETCTQLTSHSVSCFPGDVGIDIRLGDQNDRVQLSGPMGPPSRCFCTETWRVDGGPGSDVIGASAVTAIGALGQGLSTSGGDGNDVINANNGIADTVSCGSGTDKALVDLKDGPRGFPDCEFVSQAAVNQHPTVAIRGSSLRLHTDHRGRKFANVTLSCPKALHNGCRGSLAISEPGGIGRPAAIIGHTRYGKIAAGSSGRVAVTIDAAAARAVHRRGHITVRVDASEHDPKGKPKHSLSTLQLAA